MSGRIITRPRTQVAADLLGYRQKPNGAMDRTSRHLVSCMLLRPHSQIEDICGLDWTVVGSPAYRFYGSVNGITQPQYAQTGSTSNYLKTTDPILRDLPLTDGFTVCYYGAQLSSGIPSPAVVGWSGADDIVFYTGSSSSAGGARVFWRDFGGIVVDGTTFSILYNFRPVHMVFRDLGATVEIKSYVEGQLVDTFVNADVARGPFTEVELGRWTSQTTTNGGLAAFWAWDVPLTPQQIREHTNNLYGFDVQAVGERGFVFATAAPPAGATMNQLQGPNVGADLFNGTIQ